MKGLYRSGTAVLSLLMVALGLVLIGQALAAGRGIGIVLGVLFVAAGAGRIYLLRRR